MAIISGTLDAELHLLHVFLDEREQKGTADVRAVWTKGSVSE